MTPTFMGCGAGWNSTYEFLANIWVMASRRSMATRQLRYLRRALAHKFFSVHDDRGILTDDLLFCEFRYREASHTGIVW